MQHSQHQIVAWVLVNLYRASDIVQLSLVMNSGLLCLYLALVYLHKQLLPYCRRPPPVSFLFVDLLTI